MSPIGGTADMAAPVDRPGRRGDRIETTLLHCMRRQSSLSGHDGQRRSRQLPGVKRTRQPSDGGAANGPKRTRAMLRPNAVGTQSQPACVLLRAGFRGGTTNARRGDRLSDDRNDNIHAERQQGRINGGFDRPEMNCVQRFEAVRIGEICSRQDASRPAGKKRRRSEPRRI